MLISRISVSNMHFCMETLWNMHFCMEALWNMHFCMKIVWNMHFCMETVWNMHFCMEIVWNMHFCMEIVCNINFLPCVWRMQIKVRIVKIILEKQEALWTSSCSIQDEFRRYLISASAVLYSLISLILGYVYKFSMSWTNNFYENKVYFWRVLSKNRNYFF